MGLFSNEAHASIDTVNRFSNELKDLSNIIENVASSISKNIDSELEDAMKKVNELEALKEECYSLYEEIQHRKSELENLVRELSTQLENTPKEIEVEKKNSDGTVSVSKKPNPDYARIQKELKDAKSKLSQIKDLSWKVYNKKSELSRLVTSAYQDFKVIETKQKDVNQDFNMLTQKTSSALNSIQYTESAIQEYLSVRFYK